MVAIAPRRSIASFKSHHAQARELSDTPWTHLTWNNVMLFSSGTLRAGGTNKSITPWRPQTNSKATRLQTAPSSSLAFLRVVAKQRCSIPPLHTPGLRKSAAPPFHFVAIFAPPFLAGYSYYHHLKERWCKSNQSIIAIVLSAQLLFAYCVAQRQQQQTQLRQQHMSTTSPSCAGTQTFILWVIIWQTTINYDAMIIERQLTPSVQAHEPKPSCARAQAFSAKT